MKSLQLLFVLAILSASSLFAQSTKLVDKNGHINFYSHTEVEDITADNYKVVSTLNMSSGVVVFSAPMQSFEFEKSLMQKHYNSPKFLDTKQFPKAKFKGQIVDFNKVDFTNDGVYPTEVTGELTMHGVTKKITEKGTITINGNSIVVNAKMDLVLNDFEIAFKKGKPSTNIAKFVEVTIISTYLK